MSKYDDQCDDGEVICPYCRTSYQPESEDFDEKEREEMCDICGKTYWLCQSFQVNHQTRPDCSLNGRDHDYELVDLKDGRKAYFCRVCDKCKLYENEDQSDQTDRTDLIKKQ